MTTVVNRDKIEAMSAPTLSVAIPVPLQRYARSRVAKGDYGNVSEYLRDLIRRDQEEQAKKRLRRLIEEGLSSGPAQPLTKSKIGALRKRAAGNP